METAIGCPVARWIFLSREPFLGVLASGSEQKLSAKVTAALQIALVLLVAAAASSGNASVEVGLIPCSLTWPRKGMVPTLKCNSMGPGVLAAS